MTQPVTKDFTATNDTSGNFQPKIRSMAWGAFNVFLSNTGSATIQLERSPDGGTTWYPIYAGGAQLYSWSYTGTAISETVEEVEAGVIYRLKDTSHTSGTVTGRLSQ